MQMPSSLQHKLGPLPVWAWGVVVGGAWLAVGMLKGGTSTKAATAGPFATAPAGGGGDSTGGSSNILGGPGTTAAVEGGSGGAGTGGGGGGAGAGAGAGAGNTGGTVILPPDQTNLVLPVTTPGAADPTKGAGAAGPSARVPQTSVQPQLQLISTAVPAAPAPVALPTAASARAPLGPPAPVNGMPIVNAQTGFVTGTYNAPGSSGSGTWTPAPFPASNPTLTPLTAKAGGASVPAYAGGSSGGGTWAAPAPKLGPPAPVKGSPIVNAQTGFVTSKQPTTVTVAHPPAPVTSRRVKL